jgi:hypothetical protein
MHRGGQIRTKISARTKTRYAIAGDPFVQRVRAFPAALRGNDEIVGATKKGIHTHVAKAGPPLARRMKIRHQRIIERAVRDIRRGLQRVDEVALRIDPHEAGAIAEHVAGEPFEGFRQPRTAGCEWIFRQEFENVREER